MLQFAGGASDSGPSYTHAGYDANGNQTMVSQSTSQASRASVARCHDLQSRSVVAMQDLTPMLLEARGNVEGFSLFVSRELLWFNRIRLEAKNDRIHAQVPGVVSGVRE